MFNCSFEVNNRRFNLCQLRTTETNFVVLSWIFVLENANARPSDAAHAVLATLVVKSRKYFTAKESVSADRSQ